MIPDRVTVDASVMVKWVVAKDDSDRAAPLLRSEVWAPAFHVVEYGNIIWKKTVRGELEREDVGEVLRFLQDVPMQVVADSELMVDAVRLGLSLNHSVYDCMYLTLATRIRAPLVTADRRFAAKVRTVPALRDAVLTLDDLT